MKKSYILIILISFLVISPKLYAQVECPCDFESVPLTPECWNDPFQGDPDYTETEDSCDVRNSGRGRAIVLFLDLSGAMMRCGINTRRVGDACGPGVSNIPLTPEEVKACQCELLAYTSALNEVEGIEVSGGPPYECFDVDCRELVLIPIPTLSEWGLIAMAGILGIVGFMVIRRSKVAA